MAGPDGQLSSGRDIPLGGELTLSGEHEDIYGIWTMDMSPDPVRVWLVGDTGEVSVSISAINTQRPYGYAGKEFHGIIETSCFSNTSTGGYGEMFIHQQPDVNNYRAGSYLDLYSCVVLNIRKSESTTILSTLLYDNVNGRKIIDLNNNNFNPESPEQAFIFINNYPNITHAIWSPDNPTNTSNSNIDGISWNLVDASVKRHGLSVFFTEQGELTY